MSIGATMLGRRHVLPSVCSTLTELMVEGTFPTGAYLVTVHHPICTDDGDLAKALYGSFLPIPDQSLFPLPEEEEYKAEKQPGAVVTVKGKVVLNEGRKRIRLKVTSKGDRPIQVSWLTLVGGAWKGLMKAAVDWQPLPFHRDESTARIRSCQSLWLSPGHRSWHLSALRAWRYKDGYIGRDRGQQNHSRRKSLGDWQSGPFKCR